MVRMQSWFGLVWGGLQDAGLASDEQLVPCFVPEGMTFQPVLQETATNIMQLLNSINSTLGKGESTLGYLKKVSITTKPYRGGAVLDYTWFTFCLEVNW